MANPWMPGYTCPFETVGLTPGMTVDVATVAGPVITGTLIAVDRGAVCIDQNGDRYIAQHAQVRWLKWDAPTA